MTQFFKRLTQVFLCLAGILVLSFFFRLSEPATIFFWLWGLGATGLFFVKVVRPWFCEWRTRKVEPPYRFYSFVCLVLFVALILAVSLFNIFSTSLYTLYKNPTYDNLPTRLDLYPPLLGLPGQVNAMALNANGNQLVAGGAEGRIRFWTASQKDFAGPVELPKSDYTPYTKYPDEFLSIAHSPDGALLAFGSADRTIRLLNFRHPLLVHQLLEHKAPVRVLAFSPDSLLLASGSDDKTVILWRVGDGLVWRKLEKHTAPISALAFSRDGKTLATASEDGVIHLWQVSDGNYLGKIDHAEKILAMVFVPDGAELLSLNQMRNLRRHRVSDKSLINEMYQDRREPITSAAFSRDGGYFITGDSDKKVRLWETQNPPPPTPTRNPRATATPGPSPTPLKPAMYTYAGHEGTITSLAFDPTGDYFVSGSDDKTVRVWKVIESKVVQVLAEHDERVLAVSFSPNGKSVASASAEKKIRVWQWAEKRITQHFDGALDPVIRVAFSADPVFIFAATRGGTLRRWNIADQLLLRELTWEPYPLTSLAAHPLDSNRVVVGNAQGAVRYYQMTESAYREIKPFSDAVTSLAYSPDGVVLAIGSVDREIQLWKDTTEFLRLPRQKGTVTQLLFAPNGKVLASASTDGSTFLWSSDANGITATKPITLAASGIVNVMTFSRDSKFIITGSDDNQIRVWNVEDGALMDAVDAQAKSIHTLGITQNNTVIAAGDGNEFPSIQAWGAINLRDMQDAFSTYALHRFWLRPTLLRLFWATILGFILSAGVVWLLVSGYSALAARVMQAEHQDITVQQAQRWIMDVQLGIHKIEQYVANNDLKTLRPAVGDLARLGGPGVLIVEEGHAVVLQKSGRVTRVVGNGVTWLEPFERASMVVYLPVRPEKVVVKNVMTLDKMELGSVEVSVFHRVDRGHPTGSSGQYQFDEKLIREKIWSPKGGDWTSAVNSISASIIRDVVAQYNFEDMIAIAGDARQKLTNDLKDTINARTINVLGVEIVVATIGAIEISASARAALEKKIIAELDRQAQVISAEADKETRAREGEGEALKFRRMEQERTSLRKEFFKQLVDPLNNAEGMPFHNEELAKRYMQLIEKYLDVEALEKIAQSEGQKTFIVGDNRGFTGSVDDSK
ncbi:MAG: hypothetical protein HY868_01405 [Chloroflexi bacterium]|nr:hypothetical protein [Chloroflexota bacterium]